MHHAESGLHYNRHRYYHPDAGRYLTPDALGLSRSCPGAHKPGCSVLDGVAGVEVDEGEPQLPRMTGAQRRERIDELAESNAKRRVLEYEKRYDMHTVEKHGPEISDSALKQRAINGANPHTSKVPKGAEWSLSSQFSNWRIHLGALNKAISREMFGLSPHTGKDHIKIQL
ncbi:RHS repeat-associated core domain-containing protein [Pseudomonas sp. SDO5591_S426]